MFITFITTWLRQLFRLLHTRRCFIASVYFRVRSKVRKPTIPIYIWNLLMNLKCEFDRVYISECDCDGRRRNRWPSIDSTLLLSPRPNIFVYGCSLCSTTIRGFLVLNLRLLGKLFGCSALENSRYYENHRTVKHPTNFHIAAHSLLSCPAYTFMVEFV